MSHKIHSQRGQALALIAVALVAMIAITALAIDSSNVLAERRHAQQAADNAALAGALALTKGYSVSTSALNVTTLNGYSTSQVTVSNPPTTGCSGATSAYAGDSTYVLVVINSTVNTYFGPIVGRNTLSNCVEATAHGTTGGTALFGGARIVALATSGTDYAFSGSGHLLLTNSGLFSNSSTVSTSETTGSLTMAGGSYITENTPGYGINLALTGTAGIPSWYPSTSYPPITNGYPQYSTSQVTTALGNIPDPVTDDPAPSDPGTSGSISFKSGSHTTPTDPCAVISPGDYASGLSANTSNCSAWYGMNSGTYYFTGSAGFNFSSAAGIYAPTSDIIVVETGSISSTWGGGSDFFFHSLKVYTVNGNFSIGSGSDLYTNKFRFISSGTAQFSISGDTYMCGLAGAPLVASIGTRRCSFSDPSQAVPDTFMYFKSGYPTWTNGGHVNLHAPSSGDFTGLLVYLPWTNTSAITFDGGTNYLLYGTYLAPHSVFTIGAGNSATALHCQFVGYQFNFSGNACLDLNYNAGENYSISSPTVELTK